MRALVVTGIALAALTTNLVSAQTIVCPTQKEPNCNELQPPNPISCQRAFCNVVSRTVEGKNYCLWTCAAKLEDMFVNGVPMEDLLNAFKAIQPNTPPR
jgi:hypothetical protein